MLNKPITYFWLFAALLAGLQLTACGRTSTRERIRSSLRHFSDAQKSGPVGGIIATQKTGTSATSPQCLDFPKTLQNLADHYKNQDYRLYTFNLSYLTSNSGASFEQATPYKDKFVQQSLAKQHGLMLSSGAGSDLKADVLKTVFQATDVKQAGCDTLSLQIKDDQGKVQWVSEKIDMNQPDQQQLIFAASAATSPVYRIQVDGDHLTFSIYQPNDELTACDQKYQGMILEQNRLDFDSTAAFALSKSFDQTLKEMMPDQFASSATTGSKTSRGSQQVEGEEDSVVNYLSLQKTLNSQNNDLKISCPQKTDGVGKEAKS